MLRQALAASCPGIRQCPGAHRRFGTQQASVTHQMIDYARDTYEANPQMALDVLETGLQASQSPQDSSMLYLCQATLALRSGDWARAESSARSSAHEAARAPDDWATSSPAGAWTLAMCSLLEAQQALCRGDRAAVEDAAARLDTLAAGTGASGDSAVASGDSIVASGDSIVASASRCARGLRAMAGLQEPGFFVSAPEYSGAEVASREEHRRFFEDPAASSETKPSTVLDAQTLTWRAGWLLSASAEDAGPSVAAAEEAVCAAELAGSLSASQTTLPSASQATLPSASSPVPAWALRDDALCAQTLESAHLVHAQALAACGDWDGVETAAGACLASLERRGAGSAGALRALPALPLLVLARALAASARPTLAEGLFRDCAKRLGWDASRGRPAPARGAAGVHGRVLQQLAWRHAQLLTALPGRRGEAGAGERGARGAWPEDPELLGGDIRRLQGQGSWGRRGVLDVGSRSLLF